MWSSFHTFFHHVASHPTLQSGAGKQKAPSGRRQLRRPEEAPLHKAPNDGAPAHAAFATHKRNEKASRLGGFLRFTCFAQTLSCRSPNLKNLPKLGG